MQNISYDHCSQYFLLHRIPFLPFYLDFNNSDATLRGVAKRGVRGVLHPSNIQFVGKLMISDHQATVKMLHLLLILFQTSMIYINGILVFFRQIDDI